MEFVVNRQSKTVFSQPVKFAIQIQAGPTDSFSARD
ncbi:unnamed protein product [Tuber melanosporum]|uniref:(Perigord truffle) hypothetical protein n=1 Tax=Tuber melanosporum (strain Mel28) TaxID=656061 RepID=D5GL39_TUBMM|nr:uncharacterized protein GSTUM_00009958001 [Tuber melanosporum]CAZ85232.1 unnamed protein product [Tuber melanosporum]